MRHRVGLLQPADDFHQRGAASKCDQVAARGASQPLAGEGRARTSGPVQLHDRTAYCHLAQPELPSAADGIFCLYSAGVMEAVLCSRRASRSDTPPIRGGGTSHAAPLPCSGEEAMANGKELPPPPPAARRNPAEIFWGSQREPPAGSCRLRKQPRSFRSAEGDFPSRCRTIRAK